MMDTREFELAVEGPTEAESQIYIGELETVILDATRDVEIARVKTDQSTMDLGTVISVIVASHAVTKLATGVADWLRKRNDVKLRIKDKAHAFEVEGLSGEDALRVLEIMTRKG
jgi:hypothetical protein